MPPAFKSLIALQKHEGLGHSRGFLLRFSNSQKPHSLSHNFLLDRRLAKVATPPHQFPLLGKLVPALRKLRTLAFSPTRALGQ